MHRLHVCTSVPGFQMKKRKAFLLGGALPPPPPLHCTPPSPSSQLQEREASAILQDIAKARQNIQKSLAGVSTVPFIDRQKNLPYQSCTFS